MRQTIPWLALLPIAGVLLACGACGAPYPLWQVPRENPWQLAAADENITPVSPAPCALDDDFWAVAWAENPVDDYEGRWVLKQAAGDISGPWDLRTVPEVGEVYDGPVGAPTRDGKAAFVWVDTSIVAENQAHPSLLLTFFTRSGDRSPDGDIVVLQPFQSAFDVLAPAVAGNGDEAHVCVAWRDNRFTDYVFDIYAIRYQTDGDPFDSLAEVLVNEPFFDVVCSRPAVAAGPDGDYVIVWDDDRVVVEDGDDVFYRRDLYARYLPGSFSNPNGLDDELTLLETPEHSVNYTGEPQGTVDEARNPAIAYGDGRYVVAWENDSANDSTTDLYATVLDATGAPLRTPFQVDGGYVDTGQSQAAVCFLGAHRFLIGWADDDPLLGYSVAARVYDASAHRWQSDELFLRTGLGHNPEVAVVSSVMHAESASLPRPVLGVWNSFAQEGIGLQRLELRARGDVNGDGAVNGRDALAFGRVWQATGLTAAAANFDGKVAITAADTLELMVALTQTPATGTAPVPVSARRLRRETAAARLAPRRWPDDFTHPQALADPVISLPGRARVFCRQRLELHGTKRSR